jgi:uncharacterized membrane-anchored protein
MFKMRPHFGTLWLAIGILFLGVLTYLHALSDPGDIHAHARGKLVLTITIVIAGLLFILSTARMWFGHLWHDRYKNKK